MARHTRENLIADAEYDSLKIASSLQISEKDTFQIITDNGKSTLVISPSTFSSFDNRLKSFLQPLNIVKIKIYDNHKRIIYSTEKSLIGKLDSNNKHLLKSLDGIVLTELKDRQSLTDLDGEKRFEVDLAEVYVPIKGSNGQIAGVFEVYTDISEIKENFNRQLISSLSILFISLLLLSAVSYYVIIRISSSLSNAYNQLETLASTDSLTGILNRGKLLSSADNLFEMMNRSNCKFSDGVGIGVVMIDIDHFKNVNDSYGHLVGDDVLRDLTRKVEAVLRPYDVFGRYGGEEFLIFLPTTKYGEAERIADRILLEVSNKPFKVGDSTIRMTVSIGCTWTDARNENLDKVLSRVDSFLYVAKKMGRNQVVNKTIETSELHLDTFSEPQGTLLPTELI